MIHTRESFSAILDGSDAKRERTTDMRDVAITLNLLARIRYAVTFGWMFACCLVAAPVAAWGLMNDTYHLYHHERVRAFDVLMELVGLPVCVAFLWIMPQMLLKYPVLRSARLEFQWGTLSLFSRKGVLLTEIKRVKVEVCDDSIWFRNPHLDSDAFQMPFYMIPKPQRAAVLASFRAYHLSNES